VTTVDTSVAVAAALPWHEAHEAARHALPRAKTRLIANVAIETYSVLTRLPPPQRVTPTVALEYLTEAFAFPVLGLPPNSYRQLLADAAAGGISGGAVYDAVVAMTAREAGATLLTLDRRAVGTYALLGAPYELISPS